MSATYDENPCWEWEELPDFGEVVPDDYDDEDLQPEGLCEYCGAAPWLYPGGAPHVDPFGGKVCCHGCFDQIIGGDEE